MTRARGQRESRSAKQFVAQFEGPGGGERGLPGGSSLAGQRGVRNDKDVPRLTQKQILAWADEHHQATGAWPKARSGAIAAAPGETWCAVELALHRGTRGLPGGSSLTQ